MMELLSTLHSLRSPAPGQLFLQGFLFLFHLSVVPQPERALKDSWQRITEKSMCLEAAP